MFLKQYYLGCLAHASYLIADERTGVGAVVDPQRDVGQYLADARDKGFSIRHVFLTHFHAAFLAGHLELRDRAGAEICLGAKAQAEFLFRPLLDGDEVVLGDVVLKVLETPGHTPESISLVVIDRAKDPERPVAVLTGDTLFIGDVGRPDLLASADVTAEELAAMLYDSLHDKLMKLPDETLVYPAHGAGSMCGKHLGTETSSTIGTQRKYNYALQPMTKEAFVRLVSEEQPEAPAYFAYDALRNRQERPTLDESMRRTLRPLGLAEVLRLQDGGAQVLDVREAADFEGGHLAGSVNVGLRGKYATWAGTLLDRRRPIVVVAARGEEEEAVVRLGRIGFDEIAGYLEGGMAALGQRPELVRRTDRITAATLAELLAGPDAPAVLDVRTEKEWREGHVEGGVNVPLNRLEERLAEVPRGRKLVVHCQSGYRSAIAASLLLRRGIEDVADLVGGWNAWVASGLPAASGAAPAACGVGPQGTSCGA
jgi:rhodanese-related sulfurtransferase